MPERLQLHRESKVCADIVNNDNKLMTTTINLELSLKNKRVVQAHIPPAAEMREENLTSTDSRRSTVLNVQNLKGRIK